MNNVHRLLFIVSNVHRLLLIVSNVHRLLLIVMFTDHCSLWVLFTDYCLLCVMFTDYCSLCVMFTDNCSLWVMFTDYCSSWVMFTDYCSSWVIFTDYCSFWVMFTDYCSSWVMFTDYCSLWVMFTDYCSLWDAMHYFYWLCLGSNVKTIDNGNIRLMQKESAHNKQTATFIVPYGKWWQKYIWCCSVSIVQWVPTHWSSVQWFMVNNVHWVLCILSMERVSPAVVHLTASKCHSFKSYSGLMCISLGKINEYARLHLTKVRNGTPRGQWLCKFDIPGCCMLDAHKAGSKIVSPGRPKR